MSTAQVVESVLSLVGRTPVVRLRRVIEAGSATVWGKAEHLNPGGSVKDRVGLAMIEAAERAGQLRPGQLVVEPTADAVDGPSFQRAFAAVLRRDGAGFQWLADYDRGRHPEERPTPSARARRKKR